MTPPIVVGVDGSSSALQAVRWAAAEAARRGVPLRLVTVCSTPVGLPGGVVEPAVIQKALRDQGQRWLHEARQAAREISGSPVPDLVLMTASVVPALVKESLHASLLVLGTRGLGGFAGLLIGSNAVFLAGRAHCPMVVVRGAEPARGSVVVGVDGTPTSETAVAFAFADASLHGTDLVAVHAWADTSPDIDSVQQRAHETLAERLAGWQEKYPDVRVIREVVRDHPSRALLRHAEHARLVVVGTRGRGGFQGLVLGSTGQHLLHHAPCPVVVVRTEPDRQE